MRDKVLKFSDITSVIEIGQLGGKEVFLHANNFMNNTLIENLSKNLPAKLLPDSAPPTSIQSFLKENSQLPTLVIANHEYSFINKYYNSILDDAKRLGYSQ